MGPIFLSTVWAKSGPETYDFTTQAFYVENGEAKRIILNEGTITLLGCNTAEFAMEFEIFLPDLTYLFGGVYTPGEMQRLVLHQPLPIP